MTPAGCFSYNYYRRLLETCQHAFSVRPLRDDEADPPAPTEARLYLRHDIDLSLKPAVCMAEIEAEHELSATYMVIPTALTYDICAADERADLVRLIDLGHEVALHFDFAALDLEATSPRDVVERAITTQAEKLSDVIGTAVRSVSFHRPMPAVLAGPRRIAGLVNAYAEPFMRFYRSDSKASWRQGDPIPQITETAEPCAQILTHPIWWGEAHCPGPERLEQFFELMTSGMSPQERSAFDRNMAAMVPGVTRLGHTAELLFK